MGKRILWHQFFGILFLSLIIAGSSFAKEKLIVGFMGDITGAVGFWNGPRLKALQDAAEYFNETYNGIGGREVSIVSEDSRSKVDLAMVGYANLKSTGSPVWHTCGVGEMTALKPAFEKDKTQVVFTCAVSPDVLYPAGYMFGTAPDYIGQWATFADWVSENWDYAKEGRNPRFAILTYGSGYGQMLNRPELHAYFKSKKIDIVLNITIPFVTTDPLPPLVQAKEKGADWVLGQWLFMTVPPYLNANHKYKLGLKLALPNLGVDSALIANVVPREAALGLTGITSWNLPHDDTEGMKIVRQMWERKETKTEDRSASYVLGWMNMWLTKKLYDDTLARLGSWEKISPAELRKTSEGWGKINVKGLGTVFYSEESRDPKQARIVQVMKKNSDGKDVIRWDYASDWRDVPYLLEKKPPLPY